MWAWGTGNFDNEDAWDLRQVYLQCLGLDDDPAAAAKTVAARFLPDANAEGTFFWPALAGAQSDAGVLTADVAERVLALIDGGAVDQAWQRAGANAAELKGLRSALAKLRAAIIDRPRPSGPVPRALTPRNRIRTMMAPYWRRLDPRAQQVAVQVGKPPPRDLETIRRSLESLDAGQAWLVVAHQTRNLRWQKAFADDVVAASRARLEGSGGAATAPLVPVLVLGGHNVQHQDVMLLTRFEPEQQEIAAYMAALWDVVHDDPALLRPPSYPASLSSR